MCRPWRWIIGWPHGLFSYTGWIIMSFGFDKCFANVARGCRFHGKLSGRHTPGRQYAKSSKSVWSASKYLSHPHPLSSYSILLIADMVAILSYIAWSFLNLFILWNVSIPTSESYDTYRMRMIRIRENEVVNWQQLRWWISRVPLTNRLCVLPQFCHIGVCPLRR